MGIASAYKFIDFNFLWLNKIYIVNKVFYILIECAVDRFSAPIFSAPYKFGLLFIITLLFYPFCTNYFITTRINKLDILVFFVTFYIQCLLQICIEHSDKAKYAPGRDVYNS